MMRSESLMPLDRVHPPSRDTRENAHREISDQVSQYLAQGGQIQTVDHTQNWSYNQPPKRSRLEQVEWARRHNRISKKGLDSL